MSITPPVQPPANGSLTLSIRDHQIGFLLPQGATLDGANLDLPHGAIIAGTFIGNIKCEHGSVVITETARVCGRVEAERVYIEGEIASTREARSRVIGRWLVAASSKARINADLCSNAFSLHKPRFWGQLITMDNEPKLSS